MVDHARMFLNHIYDQLQGPPSLISSGHQGLFPRDKVAGYGADHSIPLLPNMSSQHSA